MDRKESSVHSFPLLEGRYVEIKYLNNHSKDTSMIKQLRSWSPILLLILVMASCKPAYKTALIKFEQGEYSEAIPLFEGALNKEQKDSDKGKIHFYIAESYRLSNRLHQAADPYSQAISERYFNDKIGLYYGLALKAKGEYGSAKEQLERFTRMGSDQELVKRAKMELQSMSMVDSLSKVGNKFVTITNLEALNTEEDEFAPALMGTEALVFSSTRGGGEVYAKEGKSFADLYYVPLNQKDAMKSDFGAAQAFDANINTKGFHEATATFSGTGNTMIFARSNSGDKNEKDIMQVNLYEAKRIKGNTSWEEPRLMSFVSSEKKWDSQPAFSADGKTLYFASAREDGYGGTDLYYATRDDNGGWSRPKNLGGDINTAGNEMYPFVDAEGKLYFSSDGHPSLGGLDLFVAVREDGVVTVSNLGKPYNSTANDFGLVRYGKENNKGFFTSDRGIDGAKGGDDIYHFLDETPDVHIVHYFLAGITYGREDGNKSILPDVALELRDSKDTPIESAISDADGNFRFKTELEMGKNYNVYGERGKDYLEETLLFTTIDKAIDDTKVEARDTTVVLETELVLTKNEFVALEEEGGEVNLTILYDLDKWDIRPDASKELDKVVEFMTKRPNLKVELGSHTDVRGTDSYNMTLSEKRAKSAVDYIVAQGIDRKRVVAKGYGETDLRVKNAKTEEEHQLNRRTTIRTLKN